MSDNQYPNTLRVRLRNLSKRDGCLPACALMARRKAPVNLNERVLETNRCHSSLDNMAVDETSKGVCSPRAWVATRRTGCRATSCGTRSEEHTSELQSLRHLV